MDKQLFDTRGLIIAGCLSIVITIGGFITWSTSMHLSSAAIAPGTIIVESQRKKIQHLDGGWVKAIHVFEGQKVQAGDMLLELASGQVDADFRRLQQRATFLQAQHDRLSAALNGRDNVTWSDATIQDVESIEYSNIIASQQLQYQQEQLHNELRIEQFSQRKTLLEEKFRGAQYQIIAVDNQLVLIEQELEMLSGLLDKGYVSKTRVMALQRNKAEVLARRAGLDSESKVLSRQVVSLEQDFKTENVELKQQYTMKMDSLSKELRDVLQALNVARDARSKVTIRSEHAGTVVGLNVHSVGGVVNAGAVLMEIVPEGDELIVDAIVKSEDIDMVRQGLKAKVRLSAYSIRNTAPVTGEVVYVAADRIPQNNDGKTGYRIKVKLNSAELKALAHINLYPGMPTEVLILLEERTLWDYFTAPLFTSYNRAFRET
ncbi:HlyD family type I secretion periplasmic adaptor subunit [Moritella sp. F3]|uniref:HlyD family type I secretion periplasmic adaptor subunit n=1 Tax=Moritella sp. F3 TaxID=2718882 RepID=UPI0018E0F600|nr:HlyD family type I secretion periplasmic adaptor subunit [Moritella sp. F3]GIC76822.1 HlyD family type I secretion periplasmic adaptor subunit [Moritella sp. F1]GIC81008.1 HlyD family type I secretion periplasmic adaptor subunit [Moritella sp. F3]